MTKAMLGIMAAALAGIVAISAAVMSRDDADAVEERWNLFQGAFDPSVVIDSIEEHYAR